MTTPDLHLLTGAYVLDALDAADRAAFEAHLADCVDCHDEVAELQATAARLAVLSAQRAPADLRARVLAEASSTRQETPVDLPAIGRRRSSSRWTRFAMPVAAVLLGVLALSVGAWGLAQRDRADELSNRAGTVASVLTAPDARTASAQIGGGRASVVVSPSQDRAVMIGTGLDAPAPGKVYEMWRVDSSGTVVSAGMYRPSADGTVAYPLDGSLDGIETVVMTVEPVGGSAQPTTPPIAAFTVRT